MFKMEKRYRNKIIIIVVVVIIIIIIIIMMKMTKVRLIFTQ